MTYDDGNTSKLRRMSRSRESGSINPRAWHEANLKRPSITSTSTSISNTGTAERKEGEKTYGLMKIEAKPRPRNLERSG
jgi:hypothetical protein